MASTDFGGHVIECHRAELEMDESRLLTLLQSLPFESASDEWRSPFSESGFCRTHLLANSPSAFWRRLSRRFPRLSHAIGAAIAGLCDEDLLDLAEPDAYRVELAPGLSVALREGTYTTGGIGRHLYAAATALAAVLLDRAGTVECARVELAGRRVLELGCGLGLCGIVAAQRGAASVRLTDYAEASVQCAAANAALNGYDGARGDVHSARLDWDDFGSTEGGRRACAAAGLGGKAGWWPDLILAADCCYSDAMGGALIQALSFLLAAAPATTRALVINGWPNRGLRRFETLVGARDSLAAQAQQALAAGEEVATSRPYLDGEAGGSDAAENPATASAVATSAPPPPGLEALRLLGTERLTGFADHAHHLYVFCHQPQPTRLKPVTSASTC
jgi:predicted nicotinamide N-methyase